MKSLFLLLVSLAWLSLVTVSAFLQILHVPGVPTTATTISRIGYERQTELFSNSKDPRQNTQNANEKNENGIHTNANANANAIANANDSSNDSIKNNQGSPSSTTADIVIRPLQLDYVDQSSHWVYMFYLLMVYRTREGHVHVPCRHVESGWPLGYWLVDQRELYRRGALDPERQQRLEDAGIVSWNLFEERFEIMKQCLREFVQRHGHANVPQRYVATNTTYGDLNLGTWLNSQRRLHKRGVLEPTRKHQLEAMGVAWNAQEAKWNAMYQCLQAFVETEKHAQVPISYIVVGQTTTAGETQRLGTWLFSQRKFWRNGTLSKDRQAKLKTLGVSPDVMAFGLKNSK